MLFTLEQLKQIKALYENVSVQGMKQIQTAVEVYLIVTDEINKAESEVK